MHRWDVVACWALELRQKGRGFDSRPFRFQVTSSGKLFTHLCLCSPNTIIWYRPRGGNLLPLATRHRLQCMVYPSTGSRLKEGRWAPSLHSSYGGTLYLYFSRYLYTYIHPFNGPLPGTTRVSRYQKGKTIWILLKQEAVSGSGISWAVCESAPRFRQTTTPAPNHSVFYRPDALPVAQPTASKH